MQLKEPDSAAFGAEALPGGLREINAQRRGEPLAPVSAPAPTQPASLVGLIALAKRYFGWGTTRR
ncbi:MAG TPA: hypothetical protein VLA30_09650 [Burkholderiales bacterium]|nr:hypothetical protein [Burkholderiales bacterium]